MILLNASHTNPYGEREREAARKLRMQRAYSKRLREMLSTERAKIKAARSALR